MPNSRRRVDFLFRFLCGAILCASLRAEDWPQFLGPRRNGSYRGEISSAWPKEGPAKSWEIQIGNGFAGPAVTGAKVFIFHRLGNEEKLDCLDAATGKPLWSNGYPATYRDDFSFDPGPRAIPAVAGDRVFTYGPDGIISAISAKDGATLWRLDAKKEFGSAKGFFGRAPSPLVVGAFALFNVGGKDANIVALDVASGAVRWKTSRDEASYASPTLAVFDGRTNALFLTRNELLALEPSTGATRFSYPFAPAERNSVTAATPLVDAGLIFLSACYGAGSTALEVRNGKPEKLWASQDAMLNHYATCVHHNGLLFGFDGRQEQSVAFACVEWKTGKTLWKKDHFGAGSVLLAKDRLLILLETGELILAEATGAKYQELQRAQILGSGVRAYPALADGFLYARGKDKLVRLDLRKL